MSIVVRYTPGEATLEQYEEVSRRLDQAGIWPPEGLDYHVAFGAPGDLRVSEIWDSREQFEEFVSQLMPMLSEVGFELAGEPEIFEVHNIVKR